MRRRRIVRLAGLIVGSAAACVALACGGTSRDAAAPKPNVVVIVTDDQATSSLRHMVHTQSLLVREGTTFPNFFLNDPICCPSRVTILLGQYRHNHLTKNDAICPLVAAEGLPQDPLCFYSFFETQRTQRNGTENTKNTSTPTLWSLCFGLFQPFLQYALTQFGARHQRVFTVKTRKIACVSSLAQIIHQLTHE